MRRDTANLQNVIKAGTGRGAPTRASTKAGNTCPELWRKLRNHGRGSNSGSSQLQRYKTSSFLECLSYDNTTVPFLSGFTRAKF